jgi:hypothetical protein
MPTALRIISVVAASVLCVSALARPPRLSSESACAKIKNRVAQLQSAAHGSDEYHCELTHEGSKGSGRHYYVFGLYSNFPAPPDSNSDWIGSSIVGWFAVSRSTGKLYRWDVGAVAIEGDL